MPTEPTPFFDTYYGEIVKILIIIIPCIILLYYTTIKLWNIYIDRMQVSDGWKAYNLGLLVSSDHLIAVESKEKGIHTKNIQKVLYLIIVVLIINESFSS